MFCNIYLSVPEDKEERLDKLMPTLQANHALCNVYRTESVVYDKASDTYNVEVGARVTLFDIEPIALVELWLTLREVLGIHCMWLDTEEFHGCTCEWEFYKQYCRDTGKHRFECSEYDL